MTEEKKGVQLPIRIRLVNNNLEANKAIYANYVEIYNTFMEFYLAFGQWDLRGKKLPENLTEGMDVDAETVLRVAIPPQLVPSLINALQVNYERYTKNWETKTAAEIKDGEK